MLMVSLMKSVGEGFSAGNWTVANYATVLASPAVRHAASLSAMLAAATATLVAGFGFLVAYLLVQRHVRFHAVLDYLAVLPLALPGTALAIALIIIYLSPPLSMLGLYGTAGILLIAYVTRLIPFGVRTSHGSLVQLSPELEEASRIAGGGPVGTVFRVTMPLVRQALIYAWVLVFILALPELSSSIMLKGVETETLSVALLDIWNGNGGLATASALGMLIFAAVGTLLGIAGLFGRGSKIG
jgi:iron(III) transport system permease protein